ncbi:MAG: hypothetical protein PHI05_05230 [Bacilli bacterium]|nr:hypothetical protein [Bacilli bacterium]
MNNEQLKYLKELKDVLETEQILLDELNNQYELLKKYGTKDDSNFLLLYYQKELYSLKRHIGEYMINLELKNGVLCEIMEREAVKKRLTLIKNK